MMKSYIQERRSWIILFLCLQSLILFVSFIDSAIPLRSISYIVYLSLIIFSVFMMMRYQLETKFYRNLSDWENHFEVTSIPHAESPFEKIIEQRITSQTELLHQELSKNLLTLEEEKDELLSWIHEVKTPLTAMKLMIDDLAEGIMKDKLTVEWLRIHLLLDRQLHQKRIPFMENDLYIENIDLKSVIFSEIKSLQSWCLQKRIGFDIDLEVPSVLSDAKWLSFITRQLLTNAVKYSEESDIIIKSFQQNEQTVLLVQDFGRGIDTKDLPRIFDKGFTSTTKHLDHSATGMGLYLAKKAAKPLRITITVHSKAGEGTTFTLTFPKRNEFTTIKSM